MGSIAMHIESTPVPYCNIESLIVYFVVVCLSCLFGLVLVLTYIVIWCKYLIEYASQCAAGSGSGPELESGADFWPTLHTDARCLSILPHPYK